MDLGGKVEEELAARVLRCEEMSLLHMVVIGFFIKLEIQLIQSYLLTSIITKEVLASLQKS